MASILAPRLRRQWRWWRWRLILRIRFFSIHVGQFLESGAEIVEVVEFEVAI